MIVLDTPNFSKKKKKKKEKSVDVFTKVSNTIKEAAGGNQAVKSTVKNTQNNAKQNNGVDLSATTIKTSDVGKINSDGYEETNKKYGDYRYDDYKTKKDYKLYKKDGKAYYYDEKNKTYKDMDEQYYTTKELQKKEYEYAKKHGYKERKYYKTVTKKDIFGNKKKVKEQAKPSSIADELELDTSGLTKKEKKKYTKAIIKQEKDKSHENYYVRKGGAGIEGFLGEIDNYINNPNINKNNPKFLGVFEHPGSFYKNVTKPISNADRIYESGKLNNEASLEYYNLMQGKKNKAEKIGKKVNNFNKFNKDVMSDDLGIVGNDIQNWNTTLTSFKHQGIGASVGTILGAVVGGALGSKTGQTGSGAVKGAKLGAKLGYVTGSTPYVYKLEAGNEYKGLREMGVSHKKAKKIAKAVGTINAAIESGENIVDLLSVKGAGKAAEKEIVDAAVTRKELQKNFNVIVDNLGEEEAKKYITKKYNKEIAENMIKTYGKNIGSEGAQEGAQETVSILGERKAAKDEGIKRDNSQDLKRIKQAAITGATSAGLSGTATSVLGNVASYSFAKAKQKAIDIETNKKIANIEKQVNLNNNLQNDKIYNIAQDISNTSNTYKNFKPNIENANISTEVQQQMKDGRFGKKLMLDVVSNQKVQEIQQALKQGQITPIEANMEMDLVKETVEKQRKVINDAVKNKNDTTANLTLQDFEEAFNKIEQSNLPEQVKLEAVNKLVKASEEVNKVGQEENINDKELKEKQLNIIKKVNPMLDEYHTGIRDIKDIKTFDEAINDDESFSWGDYSREDAERDLGKGTVTVYSSKPIEDGNFVSTSMTQAWEYAGRDKTRIHSKRVPVSNVAWINGDEGQYVGGQDIENNAKYEYNNGKEVYINDQKEYAKAMSAIHNDMSINKTLGTSYANTDEHFYIYDNEGFENKPVITMKIPITEENYNLIDIVKGELKNETYRGSEDIDTLVKNYETGRKSNNSDNVDASKGTSIRTDDILYQRSSTSESTRNNESSKEFNSQKYTELKELVDKGELKEGSSLFNEFKQLDNKLKENSNTISNEKPTKITEEVKEKIAEELTNNINSDKKDRSYTKTFTDALKTEELTNKMKQDAKQYEPITNEETYKKAKNKLDKIGDYNKRVDYIRSIANSDKKIKVDDIAEAQLVLQEAAIKNDFEAYNDLMQITSIFETEAGQIIQYASTLEKMTPIGQLKMLEKIVDREKAKGKKAWNDVELSQEMTKKVLDCYDENGNYDQQAMEEAVDEVKQDIANQLKVTKSEKANAWRYLSMLGNPRTHIRNIVANVAMSGLKGVKNITSSVIQDAAGVVGIMDKSQKTTTLEKPTQVVKDYAKTVYQENIKQMQQHKYNEKSEIESKKQIFKGKILNKLDKGNSWLLEYEDQLFKSPAFKKSFAKFLTAQGIKTQADIDSNPKVIAQAKQHALYQALEATFQQKNGLANFINKADSNALGRVVRGAIIPFTRTPLNIAKTGIEYTPGAGFATTYYAVKKAPSNLKAATFVDCISKQATGASLALVGYMLAKAGILKAGGSGDKEDKYLKDLGDQDYAITLGNKTYDLSWLSPSAMPMFVGSSLYQELEKKEKITPDVIVNSIINTTDPLSSMSCIKSFTDTLQSYSGQSGPAISQAVQRMVNNYVSQYIPTLSSQIAAAFDDRKRMTTADKTADFSWGDDLQRQIGYKLPFIRNDIEEKTDSWGRTIYEEKDPATRAFRALISPATVKKKTADKTDYELLDLYKETGEAKALPAKAQKYLEYNKEKYNLSNNEYNRYKKTYGNIARKALKELMKSDDYKDADSNKRLKMVDKIYRYASYKAKKEYYDENDVDYKPQSYKTYALYDAFNIPINEMAKVSLSDIRSDKDSYGNSIRGSYKRNMANAINALNLSIPQKAALLRKNTMYNKKATFKQYGSEIAQQIVDSDLSFERKKELLESLGYKVRY